MEIKVDYESARVNNVRSDAEKAIKILLEGQEGTIISIFPQALNPLLKAFESLGLWKQVIVLPSSDVNNKPLYLVMRLKGSDRVESIEVNGMNGV